MAWNPDEGEIVAPAAKSTWNPDEGEVVVATKKITPVAPVAPKKSLWERFVATNDPSQTPQTQPDIPGEMSMDPQAVKYAKENPAKTALGIGTLYSGPVGWAAALGLPAAATVLDKLNPFSDKPSEYQTKTAAENAEDIGSAMAFGGLAKGVTGLLSKGAGKIASRVNANKGVGEVVKETAENRRVQQLLAGLKSGAVRHPDETGPVKTGLSGGPYKLSEEDAALLASRVKGPLPKPEPVAPLDKATSNAIRTKIQEEAKALGVPNKYVTNRDIEARYMADNEKAKAELLRIWNSGTVKQTSQAPEVISSGFKEGLRNTATGALLGGLTHGPLGALVGGGAGALLKPAIDKVVVPRVTRLAPFAPAIMRDAAHLTPSFATGVVTPATQQLMDLIRGNRKGQ